MSQIAFLIGRWLGLWRWSRRDEREVEMVAKMKLYNPRLLGRIYRREGILVFPMVGATS
jgi:hypothetical protein